MQRLSNINKEIFKGIPVLENSSSPTEENLELYAALDSIDDTTQATALPLLVGSSLIFSFIVLSITNSINQNENVVPNLDFNFLQQLQLQLGPSFIQAVTSFTLFSNVAVCALFSKTEIQAAFAKLLPSNKQEVVKFESTENDNYSVGSDTEEAGKSDLLSAFSDAFPLILAVGISLISFLCPPGGPAWPLQNILNVCIAVTVGEFVRMYTRTLLFLSLLIDLNDFYVSYLGSFIVINVYIPLFIVTWASFQHMLCRHLCPSHLRHSCCV